MKISGIILTILFIGFMFTAWTLLVNDMETHYTNSTIIETEPVNETYLTTYDVSDSLNESFVDIQNELKNIQEEGGWFSGLAGGVVLAKAFIKIPAVVLTSTVLALGNFFSLGKLVGIPAALLGIIAIMITIFVTFKLLSATRRYES